MRVASIVTFRLDDITPDMDWGRFYRLMALFDKYHVKPLLGIVPDNQDPDLKRDTLRDDFWELMKSLKNQGWSIAQHGYRHIYETRSRGILKLKRASEFAGLKYGKQLEKLMRGREIMISHGLDTDIFMAPGHTFDRNTLKALKNAGFRCVSDGFMDVPCKSGGLLFIPCRSSRPVFSGGMDTICLHCNELEEEDFSEIETFLNRYNRRVLSFEEIRGQLWYPNKNPLIWLGEVVNLKKHLLKSKLSRNTAFSVYMSETYDDNHRKKLFNRIKKLPWLAIHFGRK